MRKNGDTESIEDRKARVKANLTNGEAVKKFQEMIINQGVNPNTAKALCAKGAYVWTIFPTSYFKTTVMRLKSDTLTLDFICNNFME